MSPTYSEGDILVVSQKQAKVGDVVIAKVKAREVIKRVDKMNDTSVYLLGDNSDRSTDSRAYGFVSKQAILGVVMSNFPFVKSHPAPPLTYKYGRYIGWGASLIVGFFAVLHLLRVDAFVSELNRALPGGYTVAAIIGGLIILIELGAIPFLLRLKLSPAAGFISGALGIKAPLIWLLISIWTIGSGVSSAQFGEFVVRDTNIWLLVGNIIWLSLAYVAIWSLGYDRAYSPYLQRTFGSKKKLGDKKTSKSKPKN